MFPRNELDDHHNEIVDISGAIDYFLLEENLRTLDNNIFRLDTPRYLYNFI